MWRKLLRSASGFDNAFGRKKSGHDLSTSLLITILLRKSYLVFGIWYLARAGDPRAAKADGLARYLTT